MLLTGEMIGAAEALRIGLVDEVVPAARLMERAEALAKTIVGMAPLAIAGCMEAVRWGSELGLVAGDGCGGGDLRAAVRDGGQGRGDEGVFGKTGAGLDGTVTSCASGFELFGLLKGGWAWYAGIRA